MLLCLFLLLADFTYDKLGFDTTVQEVKDRKGTEDKEKPNVYFVDVEGGTAQVKFNGNKVKEILFSLEKDRFDKLLKDMTDKLGEAVVDEEKNGDRLIIWAQDLRLYSLRLKSGKVYLLLDD